MSASVIEEIYTQIANLTLAGVPGIDLGAEPLLGATLPRRILLPQVKTDGGFVLIGTTNRLRWAIRDLCLWALLGGGDTQQYTLPMMRYIVDYIAQIKTIRGVTTQSHIVDFSFEIGAVKWGEVDHWAVDATLTVEEIL